MFDIFTADVQVMRVTRWIALPLLPKALYKLGFFEGIVKSGKTIRHISRMIFKVEGKIWKNQKTKIIYLRLNLSNVFTFLVTKA